MNHHRLIAALLPLLLASCISHIGVKKVDNACGTGPGAAKGIRYSLPQPFIVGRPQLNGKIAYSVEYLPDPDNEYAVTVWSFMAKHKMNMQRNSRGMLKSLNFTKDDTAVATSMIDTAGNLAEAHLKALNSAADGPAATDRSNADASSTSAATAHGPVIYRVVEDPRYGVRLEPVSFRVTLNGGTLTPSQQRRFETTGSPGGGQPAPANTVPKLESPNEVTLTKNEFEGSNLLLSMTFDVPANQAGHSLKKLPSGAELATSLAEINLSNSKKGTAIMKKAEFETGSYSLKLKVANAKDPALATDVEIKFTVKN